MPAQLLIQRARRTRPAGLVAPAVLVVSTVAPAVLVVSTVAPAVLEVSTVAAPSVRIDIGAAASRTHAPSWTRSRASIASRRLLRDGSAAEGDVVGRCKFHDGQPGSAAEGDSVGRFQRHEDPVSVTASPADTVDDGTQGVQEYDDCKKRPCEANNNKAENPKHKLGQALKKQEDALEKLNEPLSRKDNGGSKSLAGPPGEQSDPDRVDPDFVFGYRHELVMKAIAKDKQQPGNQDEADKQRNLNTGWLRGKERMNDLRALP